MYATVSQLRHNDMRFPSRQQLSVHVPFRVHQLYANAARHTTRAFCRDAKGRSLSADSPQATCWSLPCAIHVVYKGDPESAVRCFETLHGMLGTMRLHDWNDETPLPIILSVLLAFNI